MGGYIHIDMANICYLHVLFNFDLQLSRKLDRHIRENPKDQYLILAECKGIPSHFELKRRIRIMKKRVQKCSKDVKNFKHWKENIGFKSKQKFKAA